jgi:hypothetical protein
MPLTPEELGDETSGTAVLDDFDPICNHVLQHTQHGSLPLIWVYCIRCHGLVRVTYKAAAWRLRGA